MIRVEVESNQTHTKSGTSSRGKPYSITEQRAYAYILGDDGKPGKYPVAFKIGLEEGQQPYGVGLYTVDPRSIMVGDFDALTLGRVKLLPAAK